MRGTQVWEDRKWEDRKCRGKIPHAEEQLGPQATTAEPVSYSYEARRPRACALQQP